MTSGTPGPRAVLNIEEDGLGAVGKRPRSPGTRIPGQARPGPGRWSAQELVIHLADADAIAIDRMKRMITEDNPTLLRADEQAYVARLHCDAQSLEDAVSLFDLGRRQFGRVLRKLEESTFERVGTHDGELGRVTLVELVTTYVDHLDHHLKFVEAKRARLKSG